MDSSNRQPGPKNQPYAFNIALAAVAGQVGCLTLVIVLAALFGGLWLDAQLQTKPWATVSLMVASVPVTVVLMLWVVRKATSRMRVDDVKPIPEEHEEDAGRGTNS